MNTARRRARNQAPVRASLAAAVLMAMAAPAVFAQDCAGGVGQVQCFGATATGVFASAFGANAVASGSNTSAFGHLSSASGTNATAVGDGAIASNTNATAVGQGAVASGAYATAVGRGAQATNMSASAFGNGALATGAYASAFGAGARALASGASSFGQGAQAKNVQSVSPNLAEPAGSYLLWRHYRGFLALPAMGSWLAVVLAFKIGDAIGSPMIKPMLVDLGWSTASLGRLTLVSSLVGVGGAVLGGALYARLGARRSLLLFGFLQALGIGAMAWLARSDGDIASVYAIALFEQVADGMSTVALFAMMMNQCRPEHEGADFTIQACAQVVLAGVAGSLSGMVAKHLGYEGHFLLSGMLGLLALALVVRYFARCPAYAPAPSGN